MGWAEIIHARPALPAALGAEVEPYPYLSGFGLVHRVTRLATPLPSQVTSTLGFRNRQVTDVLLATQRPTQARSTFLRRLHLQDTNMAAYWSPEQWSPVQTGDLFERRPRPLRQCPQCAAHGYHCALFQLPSITHCPWHRQPLEHTCPRCNASYHARFDDKARLCVCTCGYDPFDPVVASVHMWDFPSDRAQAWLEDYLAWAQRRRVCRWICVPANCTEWDRGFAALAAPPSRLQRTETDAPAVIEIFSGPGADPAPRHFWGWSCWGGERPLTLAPLPATMYPLLCEATKAVVEALPPESRTPFELVDANALEASATLRENVFLRPDCFIKPRDQSGSAMWLNLSTVDAHIASFCGRVLDQATAHLGAPGGSVLASHSLQAARSTAMDQIQGRGHLAHALAKILTRAYAHGLRADLGVKLDASIPRAAWPILEMVGESGRLRAARLNWIEQKSAAAPAHVERRGERPASRPLLL
ncbi:hypothetical protein [Pseudoxanthomonas sp. Root630]|uniref:hypothetical protein n=1 Tax=Pseudoxanthomonas sp. Root630 TaxID=1736574 RepID=UPI000702DDBF|nr:hypothetical protein [Pseudoxanthomonas sp. Root630]KRA50243.1 hypothetical protein ASD72_18695 [Pseudoxanthomonas sp. Root630]